MNTMHYADVVGWEAWQEKYRYGAFYLFPPADVIEPLDALRRTYDARLAAICQAHISLSAPLAGPLDDDGIDEISAVLAGFAPFDIRYGPLRSFPPHPGVAYSIQPEDPVMWLRALLHATSLFAGRPLARAQIAPHLTIAEFISTERTDELLRELSGKVPEGTFRCAAVEYAVPNTEFSFERVLELPLGQKMYMAREIFPGITMDPQVVHGRPVVAGTRVPVEVVIGELAGGSSVEEIMQDYHLTNEQIRAAVAYSAADHGR